MRYAPGAISANTKRPWSSEAADGMDGGGAVGADNGIIASSEDIERFSVTCAFANGSFVPALRTTPSILLRSVCWAGGVDGDCCVRKIKADRIIAFMKNLSTCT